MINRYVYFAICIILGGWTGMQIVDYLKAHRPVNAIDTKAAVNFREHEIAEQVNWALCYIDAKSDHIRAAGQQYKCPKPEYPKMYFDAVVGEIRSSELPEMKACFVRKDLVNVVVLIGETMYVNLNHNGSFGVTKETAIPIAAIQMCTKMYNQANGKENPPLNTKF